MCAERFRPCIDLHNGCVKRLMGGTLRDVDSDTGRAGSSNANFTLTFLLEHYATMHKRDELPGSHIITLGIDNSDTARAALAA